MPGRRSREPSRWFTATRMNQPFLYPRTALTPGTAIIWAAYSQSGAADGGDYPGVFQAFDASTLTEIWGSETNPGRDYPGSWSKWSPPTIANGKVYLASFDDLVDVYGLLPLARGQMKHKTRISLPAIPIEKRLLGYGAMSLAIAAVALPNANATPINWAPDSTTPVGSGIYFNVVTGSITSVPASPAHAVFESRIGARLFRAIQ